MCELLGMNCNVPTDICFSFAGFRERGGSTGVHVDGWGIAFFEGESGKGTRVFLDPQPSAKSQLAELVRSYPIHSKNVIAHIRKATQGSVGLENTHPFRRELWGRYWIFAHNGNLEKFSPTFDGSFIPVGSTDSEHAFCYILQQLKNKFTDYKTSPPDENAIFDALHKITLEICNFGEFNFLLSFGNSLFAHASTRLSYIVRKAPFAQAHLKDQDLSIDFSQETTENDQVCVIATLPLTDNEIWQTMEPGTLWRFFDGEAVQSATTIAGKRCYQCG